MTTSQLGEGSSRMRQKWNERRPRYESRSEVGLVAITLMSGAPPPPLTTHWMPCFSKRSYACVWPEKIARTLPCFAARPSTSSRTNVEPEWTAAFVYGGAWPTRITAETRGSRSAATSDLSSHSSSRASSS
jgi:hypothetical protein